VISKVIFLIESAFNRRGYHRFGFDILINRGFEVVILDFTPYLRPKYFNDYVPPDIIDYTNHYFIHGKNDAESYLNQIDGVSIVVALLAVN